jgi:hypothetical protein
MPRSFTRNVTQSVFDALPGTRAALAAKLRHLSEKQIRWALDAARKTGRVQCRDSENGELYYWLVTRRVQPAPVAPPPERRARPAQPQRMRGSGVIAPAPYARGLLWPFVRAARGGG